MAEQPDIPPLMKASKSTEFGCDGSLILVSYVRKKGMAVALLSTMHHSKVVITIRPKEV